MIGFEKCTFWWYYPNLGGNLEMESLLRMLRDEWNWKKIKIKYGYIKLKVFEVYGSNCKNGGTSRWLNEVFLSIN